MALKFGTSGVRGLVLEMSDCECYLYTRAFVQYVKKKCLVEPKAVALAGDYRSSTPWIKDAVAYGIHLEGLRVNDCGAIATPAVTAYSIHLGLPSVMVTGSHISADRNGIKFNLPWGEILKDDEVEISKGYAALRHEEDVMQLKDSSIFRNGGSFKRNVSFDKEDVHAAASKLYEERFTSFFPKQVLAGLKVVFYEHASVSRDIGPRILRALGAEVISIKRSDVFVAIDTEAINNTTELANWIFEHDAD
ncbi:MAG TPA: phosphomannomutase, partial [Thermodesulfovibrionia bacterium]|nr:phosphomannomutase [Thermodesulfovibrionia bacterium]